RAPFTASGSSIGRRIRQDTRLPHWPWGQPERYSGRAGSRDVIGGGSSTSPSHCGPADISASLPNAGWLTFPARQHPGEVCPLARGVMLPCAQPLSSPLPAGLRLLPDPLPAAPSAHLAARFPGREDYGLTTFRQRNRVG